MHLGHIILLWNLSRRISYYFLMFIYFIRQNNIHCFDNIMTNRFPYRSFILTYWNPHIELKSVFNIVVCVSKRIYCLHILSSPEELIRQKTKGVVSFELLFKENYGLPLIAQMRFEKNKLFFPFKGSKTCAGSRTLSAEGLYRFLCFTRSLCPCDCWRKNALFGNHVSRKKK